MDEIVKRFFEVYDRLKEKGRISSYLELGGVIGTNKAGVSDIKYGRKKLSIENLLGLKNSYDEINIDWILSSRGEMTNDEDEKNQIDPKDQYIIELQKDKIRLLEEQIKTLKKGNNTHSGYLNIAEPDP